MEYCCSAVLWNETTQTASFEYDADFIKKGYKLAPLKMSLVEKAIYNFPELRYRSTQEENTFSGLPGLLQ